MVTNHSKNVVVDTCVCVLCRAMCLVVVTQKMFSLAGGNVRLSSMKHEKHVTYEYHRVSS